METPKFEREAKQERLQMLQASLRAVMEDEDLFAKIIEFFPYPIEVYARDGTAVMVNRALLDEFKIPSRDMIVGRYNVFKDPKIEESGLLQMVREVFTGKTVTATDIRAPIDSLRESYKIEDLDIAMYQDATGFPIFDGQGEVAYVAMLLVTRRVYRGKAGVASAAEYIESHCGKAFDLNAAAKAANLSPYHFSRVFKSDVGLTPHNYYIKCKLERLMQKLRDESLTVKEAFLACGMEYTGYSFGVFKRHVGVTPTQYRERVLK
jgi:AraC-like DNA-binding protein